MGHASFYVALVIEGSFIAAPLVAHKRAGSSGAQPVSVINAVSPGGSIIGIANALIVVGSPPADTLPWQPLPPSLPPLRHPPSKKT